MAVTDDHGFGLKLTLMIAASLTIMAGATISPSLPALRDHFIDTPNVEVLARLALTLPALVIAIVAPFGGWLVDRIGRTRVLFAACLLYAVAGGSGLWVESLTALLVGRAFLGLAVALVMTSATALVGDYFEGPERAKFMGMQASAASFGGLLFVTGGGVLAEVDWRAPYWIYISTIGVAFMVAAFLYEPDRTKTRTPQAGDEGDKALAFAFLALAFFNFLTFYTIPTQLPFFLLAELEMDRPSLTGAAIGMMTLFSGIIAMFYGRIAQHVQMSMVLAVGLAVTGMSYALIGMAPNYGVVVAAMIGAGLGGGLVWPATTLGLMSATPAHLRGRFSGGLTSVIFAGQFVSPLFSQPLIPFVGLPGIYILAGGSLCILGFVFVVFTYLRNKKALRDGRA